MHAENERAGRTRGCSVTGRAETLGVQKKDKETYRHSLDGKASESKVGENSGELDKHGELCVLRWDVENEGLDRCCVEIQTLSMCVRGESVFGSK